MDDETRRVRRDEQRLAIRRRRAAGLAALLLVAAALAAIALSAGGSGSPSARSGATQQATSAHSSATSTPPASTAGAGSGPPGHRAVPILMYHVIAPAPAGAPFPGLYVPPPEFAEQMNALKSAGWHAVTLDQVEAYWTRGVPLGPGRPIVVSFDNGYESQYTQAFPTLRGLGWVGDENLQLTGLPPSQGGIGQREVREMLAAGWELDTQGFSHADLVTLSATALHHEVAESRTLLQRRFHVQVNWFCYPSGHYDPRVIAEVRAAGYAGSTTVVPGWAHPGEDPYRLPRLRVLGGTSGAALLSELASIRSDPPAPPSYTGA